MRVTLQFRRHDRHHRHDKNQRHGPQQRMALTVITHHAAKGEAQRAGDQEYSQHLHHIGHRRRVFERMRRVGTKEATAVGPQHFNRFLRSNWPHRQGLLHPFERGDVLIDFKILQYTLTDKIECQQQRDRQQQIQCNAQ